MSYTLETEALAGRLNPAILEHDAYATMTDHAIKMASKCDELQTGFDLRWKATRRGIKRWQDAHPGKERTWPDHADHLVWLIEENQRMIEVDAHLRALVSACDEFGGGASVSHPRYTRQLSAARRFIEENVESSHGAKDTN